MWFRGKHAERALEKELRAFRSEAPTALVDELEARAMRPSRARARRLGLAAGLAAAVLIPFGAFGGFGYAASATENTFTTLTGVKLGISKLSTELTTSASVQYCPKKSTRLCPPGQNKPPHEPPPCPTGPDNGHPCEPRALWCNKGTALTLPVGVTVPPFAAVDLLISQGKALEAAGLVSPADWAPGIGAFCPGSLAVAGKTVTPVVGSGGKPVKVNNLGQSIPGDDGAVYVLVTVGG